MQNRAFEKYIWGTSFIFCALMVTVNPSEAGTVDSVMAHSQNPYMWGLAMLVTFIGAKMCGSKTGQF